MLCYFRYNDVLKNGLPNWKSALYYYRHVRKMGLAEMAIILFVIITICQYIISWAAYAEKKYTAVSLANKFMHFFFSLRIPQIDFRNLCWERNYEN